MLAAQERSTSRSRLQSAVQLFVALLLSLSDLLMLLTGLSLARPVPVCMSRLFHKRDKWVDISLPVPSV